MEQPNTVPSEGSPEARLSDHNELHTGAPWLCQCALVRMDRGQQQADVLPTPE